MTEVTDTRKHHRHVVLIAKGNRVLILNRSSQLNHRRDAGLPSQLNTIGKWEERVRSHYRSLQVEPEGPGFFNRLFKGIDPGCLTRPAGQHLAVRSKHNRVRLGMLTDFRSKQ